MGFWWQRFFVTDYSWRNWYRWRWRTLSPPFLHVPLFSVGGRVPPFFLFLHLLCTGTQMMIYVSMEDCGGLAILAWSSFCSLDQYGRPVAGSINFCPSNVEGVGSSQEWAKTIGITIHELTHALGFSTSLFNSFVDENRMFCFAFSPFDTPSVPFCFSPPLMSSSQTRCAPYTFK